MRILFLSFYFRPDLSAGAFRATSLAEALRELGGDASHIDVITTLPNRYQSFAPDAPVVDEQPGLLVHRIPVPAHQSGMLDQSKAFAAFARGVIRLIHGQEYDLVLATSSRLMTAVLGAAIARRKRARLYLDIRDLFAQNLRHTAPGGTTVALSAAFSLLERWAVGRADKVNLVSRGFARYFQARYPRKPLSFYTNGVDDEFLMALPMKLTTQSGAGAESPRTVVYAGNIGQGQGLHMIIPALAKRLGERVHFRVIGDGGRKRELEAALAASGVENVTLVPPMDRSALLGEYRDADVLFLHLNDYAALRDVLPSKVFEYGATGKPIWAGVTGYAADFIESELTNAAVFPPCDVAAAASAFDRIIVQDTPRPDFLAKYGRTAISRKLAEDVLSVARA